MNAASGSRRLSPSPDRPVAEDEQPTKATTVVAIKPNIDPAIAGCLWRSIRGVLVESNVNSPRGSLPKWSATVQGDLPRFADLSKMEPAFGLRRRPDRTGG